MNTLQSDTALGQPEWTDNWTIGGCGSLHMEIMNAATGDVWLAQQPVTDVQFEALVPPPGFQKSGIGQASVDAAYFRRSPGASADGPVETMEVDGLCFARVARPVRFEPGHRGLWVAYIDKYHRVLFKAGRSIEIMDCGDGNDYLQQVSRGRGPILAALGISTERQLPQGWSVRTVTLAKDLLVELPNPARVVFFSNGDSFQGPLQLEPSLIGST